MSVIGCLIQRLRSNSYVACASIPMMISASFLNHHLQHSYLPCFARLVYADLLHKIAYSLLDLRLAVPSEPTPQISEPNTIVLNDPIHSRNLQNTQQIVSQLQSQNVQQYIYQNPLQNQMLAHKQFGHDQSLLMQLHASQNQQQQFLQN